MNDDPTSRYVIPKDLDQLRRWLDLAVGVEVSWDANGVTARGQNEHAFDVTLWGRDPCTIGFDGWHHEFDNLEEAITWFLFGLSPRCRLRVTVRGGWDYRWEVQSLRDGDWIKETSGELLLVPFWKPAKIIYRRNLVTPPPASPAGSPGSEGGSAR